VIQAIVDVRFLFALRIVLPAVGVVKPEKAERFSAGTRWKPPIAELLDFLPTCSFV